jgi:hypothetical protein
MKYSAAKEYSAGAGYSAEELTPEDRITKSPLHTVGLGHSNSSDFKVCHFYLQIFGYYSYILTPYENKPAQ